MSREYGTSISTTNDDPAKPPVVTRATETLTASPEFRAPYQVVLPKTWTRQAGESGLAPLPIK